MLFYKQFHAVPLNLGFNAHSPTHWSRKSQCILFCVFEGMLCFSELCRTLTADQLAHAESRGGWGGGGGGGGLVERTLPVGHVEQVGLRWRGSGLTLLLDTHANTITHTVNTTHRQRLLHQNAPFTWDDNCCSLIKSCWWLGGYDKSNQLINSY